MQTLTILQHVTLTGAFSARIFQCITSFPKKGKGWFFLFAYGRLRSARTVAMKQTMMTMMIAATAGMKYWSIVFCCGGCVGATVGAAGSTAKLVSAYDGQ